MLWGNRDVKEKSHLSGKFASEHCRNIERSHRFRGKRGKVFSGKRMKSKGNKHAKSLVGNGVSLCTWWWQWGTDVLYIFNFVSVATGK